MLPTLPNLVFFPRTDTALAGARRSTLWGLSKLGIADGELFKAVGAGALRSLAGFNAQNLANSVWAYANLGLSPGEEALDAYARASIERMGEATPQNLVRGRINKYCHL